jgi:hypothetical protein
MLAGTLCGVEMGLRLAGVPIEPGIQAALDALEREPEPPGVSEDLGRVRQAAAEPAA